MTKTKQRFDSHQIDAISSDAQTLVVLAGAGSGKTTTMIARMLRAINAPSVMSIMPKTTVPDNIPAEKIRAVSFTNTAADTLRARLFANGGQRADAIEVSTMDKFCIQIIQHVYPNAQVSNSETNISETLYYHMPETRLKQQYPTYAKYYEDIYKGTQKFARGYEVFQKENVYDRLIPQYVTHIIKTTKDRNAHIEIPLKAVYQFALRLMVEEQFVPDIELLIVDEFQDSNVNQFLLINFLKSQLPNLKFIGIGDVSQSMYRWNQAQPGRVRQFIKEWDADTKNLPNNYRSHKTITDYANGLLKHNFDNINAMALNYAATRTFDEDIKTRIRYADLDEIIYDIQSKIDSGVDPSDIAVIARNNSRIQNLQELRQDSNARFEFSTAHYDKNRKLAFAEARVRLLTYALADCRDAQTEDKLRACIKRHSDRLESMHIIHATSPLSRLYDNTDSFDTKRDKVARELERLLERAKVRVESLLWQPLDKEHNKVVLSSVHGIKGEEYLYVYYIPTMIDSSRQVRIDTDTDESDRELIFGNYAETQNIHYVAATRAIEQLTVVGKVAEFIASRNDMNNRISKGLQYNDDMDALLSHMTHEKFPAVRKVEPNKNKKKTK